ncbi:MAG: hypothetical protein ACPGED_03345 [Flavobacteriales bacterium]
MEMNKEHLLALQLALKNQAYLSLPNSLQNSNDESFEAVHEI